jgi:hypothetical protein
LELCKFSIHVITSVRDVGRYTNVEQVGAESHSKMAGVLHAIGFGDSYELSALPSCKVLIRLTPDLIDHHNYEMVEIFSF